MFQLITVRIYIL
uniref:Uncharacterized protein n=1 Tax=Rhizophora mucronata TaxID=61149 RepID=A0A2P2L6H9_RHIMU